MNNFIVGFMFKPPPPSTFIAGCPRAAPLVRFFGDFRCGVMIFTVILVIYKYENR